MATDPYEPQRYVKRPIPITAQKMRDAFVVETLEGVMTGQAGDYLITGVRGEQYPCAAAIFEESYREVSRG